MEVSLVYKTQGLERRPLDKMLAVESQNTEFNHQDPHFKKQKPWGVVHACNPSAGERDRQADSWGLCPRFSSSMSTHICTQNHLHTHECVHTKPHTRAREVTSPAHTRSVLSELALKPANTRRLLHCSIW